MLTHRWGLGLELGGFFIIGVIVSVFLLNKSYVGSKYMSTLDKVKAPLNRLLNKTNKKPLKWFTEADRLTVSALIIGTVIYFVGLILKAISEW